MPLVEAYQIHTPGSSIAGDADESMTEELELEDKSNHKTETRALMSPNAPATRRSASPGATGNHDKKYRVTTEARRAVEDRSAGQARQPSSPADRGRQDVKRTKHEDVQMDQPNDDDHDGDMRILSAILRGADIVEVFSPERVTKVCAKYKLMPGDSFDLRNGYDLADKNVQRKVIHQLYGDGKCPGLLIGSPPCTHFSQLVALNLHVQGPEWAEKHALEKIQAIEHIRFCIKLFKMQNFKSTFVGLQNLGLALVLSRSVSGLVWQQFATQKQHTKK